MSKKKPGILMYGAGASDANILYATRFFCPDPFMFVETPRGRRIMVIGDLELDRARATASVHRVLPLVDYVARAQSRGRGTPHVVDVIAEVLRDLKISHVRVPHDFPAGIADGLRRRRVAVTISDHSFSPSRARKDDNEIKAIARAMRATEAGMAAAVEVLRAASIRGGWVLYDGRRLTCERLRAIANTAVIERGCMPWDTIVASGRRSCDPHDTGSGPIRANHPIIIDIYPRSESTGYYGDMTRTFVKGTATTELSAMYAAVRHAQKYALGMIHDGVRARRVHEAIHEIFRERGFTTGVTRGRREGFFHGTGHGIGLEIHEPPRVTDCDDVLRRGMVVTVEPGLYYAAHGGVRIEDTVVVTNHGVKNLTRFRKFLEIE